MLWLCLSSRFSLDIILKVDLEAIEAILRLWTDFTEAYFCPQGNTQILYEKDTLAITLSIICQANS